MERFTGKVADKNGIHARPAGQLVNFIKNLGCDVKIVNQDKEADGKRLLSVMMLGAKQGDELTFILMGENELESAKKLEDFWRALQGESADVLS